MAQVVPGCEAWSADGGDAGVLVLHGFTGNPCSTRPLAEALAHKGFAVEMPRLPGHGTRWQELAKTTWCDWMREATASLERLRARTRAQVVVGLSMGGALTLYLAETRDDLAGIVLINPFVELRHPLVPVLPALQWVLPCIKGVGNDIARPGSDEKPYRWVPLRALASLVGFQARVRENLEAVTAPALVLTSRQDHTVDPGNSQLVVDGIAADDVEHVWLDRSFHVATLDYDDEEVERRTATFVTRVTAHSSV